MSVIDLGALGPEWRLHEELDRTWRIRPPANTYFTRCPVSVTHMPIVNGITHPDRRDPPPPLPVRVEDGDTGFGVRFIQQWDIQ